MIWSKAKELEAANSSFVMITMTNVIGAAPQIAGAKCLVTKEGLVWGTIGGGKVEAQAINYAKDILLKKEQSKPLHVKWNLQTDVGMTCGGVVEFIFEHFCFANWPIAIFGAGHVSQKLVRLLATIQCQVTVIDDRDEWLNKLPTDTTILKTNNAKEAVSHFSEKTFFICMTKGHAFDVPFLDEISKQFPNTPYVGVIGSRSKGNAIRKDLRDKSVDENFLEKLRVPIGLPIGNNTPGEISVSIVAELIQVRDQLNQVSN